jgi:putative transposase
MIDSSDPKLSISWQCRMLSVSRSSFYHRPRLIKPVELMRLIDEQYLKTPC